MLHLETWSETNTDIYFRNGELVEIPNDVQTVQMCIRDRRYDDWLSGEDGKILTMTNAYGQELEQEGERRQEPVTGNQLTISLDCNLQMYCEQAAQKVMLEKNADEVSVILIDVYKRQVYDRL